MILYKYLPREYAEAFVLRGELLFRSLFYFRKLEHAERGDEVEGVHIDAPNTPVLLENLTTGTSVSGAFRFLNSVDQERVFAFCCSTELRLDLFERFHADACVRILRTLPLFSRCALSAAWKFPLADPGFIHKAVEYFDPAGPAVRNVKDPLNLPFFKHIGFSAQREYRAVFARRGAFKLQERIVNPGFSFAEEIELSRASDCLLSLGSLTGIADVVLASDPAVHPGSAGTHHAA
jgi:hypothetical protein